MNIVAYTFRAETYCPDCIIDVLIAAGLASPAAKDMFLADALNQIAGSMAIDRMDEHSFDSGEFPKVVLSSQIGEVELCDKCAEEL